MSKKIIISESQYRRVFLNEQPKPVPTGSEGMVPLEPTDTLSVSELIPDTKVDTCKPAGGWGGPLNLGGVGEKSDWCGAISKVDWERDCYMGNCHIKHKGYTYYFPIPNRFEGRLSFSSQSLVDTDTSIFTNGYPEITSYIVNWNNVIERRESLKDNTQWTDSAELIDNKWLNKNGNNLSAMFDRQNGIGNSWGIGSTTVYNPGWLIQKYFQIIESINVDLLTDIKSAEFKAVVRERTKEYDRKYEEWTKKMDIWNTYFGELKREEDNFNQSVDLENERIQLQTDWTNFPKPQPLPDIIIPPVEYDINNPDGKSFTEKDKIELYKKYDYIPKLKPDGGKEGVKKFQDWLDSKNFMWVNGNNLNKGPGYGNFGELTKKHWKLYSFVYDYETNKDERKKYGQRDSIPSMPKMPQRPSIIDAKREDTSYLSDLEKTKVTFELLMSAVDSFNSVILTQHKGDVNKFCRNINGVRNVPGSPPPYGAIPINQGTKDFKYLWFIDDICNNTNEKGAWVYSQGKNSKVCGCVRTPKGQNIGLLKNGGALNFEKIIKGDLANRDIRNSFEKLSDWATGCMDDWHCVADIASIGVLFLPIPGVNLIASAAIRTGVSALIDLTSAVGYAVEGDEGWELNASLTLLGTVFSGVESAKYIKMASNGDKTINKISKTLNKSIADAEKMTKEADFLKLSASEQSIKYSNKIREGLEGLSSTELKELGDIMIKFNKDSDKLIKELKEVITDLKGLTADEKVGFREVIKKMGKDEKFAKEVGLLYLKDGKDALIELSKKYVPNMVKDAVVQSTLFGLMQGYPEETAKFIFSGLEKFKELTGIDLIEKMKNKDKDPEDQETKDVEEIIDTFQIYEQIAAKILSHLNSTQQKDIKNEYGVDLSTLKDKIFSGEDPLFPNQLKKLDVLIEEFFNEVDKLKNDNSIEDKTSYVKDLFDTIVSFIDSDKESEANIKKLYDIYKNNPCVNCDLRIDNFEEYRKLQQRLELIDGI